MGIRLVPEPPATQTRQEMQDFLDLLVAEADGEQNTLLLMAATALSRVHQLFPGAEAPRHRGTGPHQAHVLIHNAIVDVFDAYLVEGGCEEPPESSEQADPTVPVESDDLSA